MRTNVDPKVHVAVGIWLQRNSSDFLGVSGTSHQQESPHTNGHLRPLLLVLVLQKTARKALPEGNGQDCADVRADHTRERAGNT